MNGPEQILQNLVYGSQGGNRRPRNDNKEHPPGIYVANLPTENFYDLDFFKFFTSKNYKVSKAKVVLDKKTSKPRGFGYLSFYTQEEADRCLKEMNNAIISGHSLRLLPLGKQNYNEKANILVKNLDKDVTQ